MEPDENITAEEFLNQQYPDIYYNITHSDWLHLMRDFAKLKVKEALDAAKEVCENSYKYEGYYDCNPKDIIESYPLDNIK